MNNDELSDDKADALVQMFQAIAAAGDDYDYDDYKVEVKTYNDRNYYVVLHVKGKRIALEPNWAREIAEELLTAAHEAEEAEGNAIEKPMPE